MNSYGNLILICKYYTIVSVCMCYIKLYKTGETVLYNLLDPSKSNLLLISNLAASIVSIYNKLIIKSIRNWVFMIRMLTGNEKLAY